MMEIVKIHVPGLVCRVGDIGSEDVIGNGDSRRARARVILNEMLDRCQSKVCVRTPGGTVNRLWFSGT